MQSSSIEDYIKYIYQIQTLEKRVSTSCLAKKLKISPASVSEMLSKLSVMKLIKNTPYHGFVLTPKGENMAVKLVRKHRIIEVFLNQHLVTAGTRSMMKRTASNTPAPISLSICWRST